MLKIVCIYLTNQFEEGVRIKVSRLNHSCQPNARILPENGEVRAISDIKPGQEVTISYRPDPMFSMKNKESRQKILKPMGFICNCDLCKNQSDVGHTRGNREIQFKIDELIEEAEKLQQERSVAFIEQETPAKMFQLYPPEKCRKEVNCYKQLYKLGKAVKVHPSCLYELVGLGFQAATNEYQICWFNQNPKLSGKVQTEFVIPDFFKEFEAECVNFAKTAEAFGKLLGAENVNPENWRRIHRNYRRYFFEELSRLRRSFLRK